MPGWRFLPLHQREQLVRYIRVFDTEERYPEPIVPEPSFFRRLFAR